MRNLSDREIQNILRLKLNAPINPINFRSLIFTGRADGTTLTRRYNNNDLKNNYVRIISLDFGYYAFSTWMRENAQDNKSFTSNTNSRYSMVRDNIRIDPYYLELQNTANKLQIFVDGNNLNIFSNTHQIVLNKIDLNILIQNTIVEGIDIKYNLLFTSDMQSNINNAPNVSVSMNVELLNDINPFQITQEIKDDI